MTEDVTPKRRSLLLDTGGDPSAEDSHAEDELDAGGEEEGGDGDVQSIIGVSIGAPQERLRSPKTPATEIEEALRGGDPWDAALQDQRLWTESKPLDGRPVHTVQPDRDDNQRPTAIEQSSMKQSRFLPSLDGAFASSIRGAYGRPRAGTARSTEVSGSHSRKISAFNLPSLPSLPSFAKAGQFSLPSIDGALAWAKAWPTEASKDLAIGGSSAHAVFTELPETSQAHARRSSFGSLRDRPQSPESSQTFGPPRLLRHSTSDNSLNLYRTQSKVSSLGDDTRWEDIQHQVNSRMKAIKDSWADANFSLPRFRPTWLDSARVGGHPQRGGQRSLGSLATSLGNSSSRTSMASNVPTAASSDRSKSSKANPHPSLERALSKLTGDIVILGGYRGSVLRSAEPPHRQLWVPVKVGLNIRKVNLEVGLEPEDEERMPENIIPDGMLNHIGPVEISRRLIKRLRTCDNTVNGYLRVHDYGYDWRLSPHLLSSQLEAFLASLPCNKRTTAPERRGATVIAHSLGGLIIRHIVNRRPELVSGVVYAGVPQTCVNILGPLRNGDSVLMSKSVLTAQVNFTIRTSFALLPLDGECFIDEDTKESYPIDFFDPKTWEEYCLSPCIARPLGPSINGAPEPQGLVSSLVGSMSNVLPSGSVRRNTLTKAIKNSRSGSPAGTRTTAEDTAADLNPSEPTTSELSHPPNPPEKETTSTAVTLDPLAAKRYLTRTLAGVKSFKLALAHQPHLHHRYPPTSIIYSTTTPTVKAARVSGREAIKYSDAFDHLLFGSGDGVVLARAAQLPEGYEVCRGGRVHSERGHIGLLGDLEGTGRALLAVIRQREQRTASGRGGGEEGEEKHMNGDD